MWRSVGIALLVSFVLAAFALESDNVHEHKREPIILIPGFASSRLMAWKQKICGSGFNINIGDRVWVDAAQVLYDSFREGCWSDCMALQLENQTDPIDCKLRPVSSIEAISELDPGQITGPLSSIFRNIIDLLSGDYDYDTTNLAAAPYDWRLPPSVLEERDRYFSSLKATIEEMVDFNQKPAIIIAHSMGNNVFLYFTEWIQSEYPDEWEEWFDSYVSAFFLVGAPLLGSPQSIRVAISGSTFGLPLSEVAVRRFMNTFGSGPWMFPVHDPSPNTTSRGQGGWPVTPITVDYHDTKKTRHYVIDDVLNGTLFRDAAKYDQNTQGMARMLDKFYLQQKINPLARAPARPPVKNIYCVYGINTKTEIGYQYRIVDEAFRVKKVTWEDDGGEVYSTTALLNRKEPLEKSAWGKSGDGTVPYNSLNWCQAWHVSDVRLTEVPTEVDTSSRLQGMQQLLGIEKLIYGKYRYDSSAEVDGRLLQTSVIELEHQNHRDIIRSPGLIELLKEELDPRTQIQYTPFKQHNAATEQDLTAKATNEIKEMMDMLQRELARREHRLEEDRERPAPHASESSTESSDSETPPVKVFHQDQPADGKPTRQVTPEDEQSIHREHATEEQVAGQKLSAVEGPGGQRAAVIDTLRGDNVDGLQEEVEDIRDDDTGHEFVTDTSRARL